MKKFGLFVANHRVLVLIVATLLLIPAFLGFVNTKVNYDLLTYLPQELDSTKGQIILEEDFSNSATSMLMVQNMEDKDVVKLKEKIGEIETVQKVVWIDDIADITVPREMLPTKIKDMFFRKDTTLLMIKFNNSASSEATQFAIRDIRKIAGQESFLAGMSAIIKDTRDIADKEAPVYILIAVVLCAVVLAFTNESYLLPVIFLLSIGYAVLYNMGTNIFLGKISYVTKVIAAVLQLGVTMDYSIFLMHRYDEERNRLNISKPEAMAVAIKKTFISITGSSTTTIAGFLVLCAMQLSLGKDIGLVMAKGVVLGLICTITVLPAFILVMDKPIHRLNHRTLLPNFEKTAKFVTKHYRVLTILFVVLFIPAVYGAQNTKVYYNLDESLPKDLPSIVATNKLKEDYKMTTTHFVLVDKDTEDYKLSKMVGELEKVDGINEILAKETFVGPLIPDFILPDKVLDEFEKNNHKLFIIHSEFQAARENMDEQINKMNEIIKSYDKDAMITGEGALTKDLMHIADVDFKRVSLYSIVAVFIIIMLIFTSLSIPVLLVLAIELAIFINMAVPFYTNSVIPFVSSIVVGTIQLGSTIDYAILLTTRFREEIRLGKGQREAMEVAVSTAAKPIVTSALSFFAATIGVAIISDMEMVSSLCHMMARGAIISMLVIIVILPSIMMKSEKLINKTSRNFERSIVDKIKNKA